MQIHKFWYFTSLCMSKNCKQFCVTSISCYAYMCGLLEHHADLACHGYMVTM